LLLTMGDGREVVAKIPNPNAGPAGLTVASEVATMDFVSGSLSLLSWDHANETVFRMETTIRWSFLTKKMSRCARLWGFQHRRSTRGAMIPGRRASASNTSSWKRSRVFLLTLCFPPCR
jgi:hypothetical protein